MSKRGDTKQYEPCGPCGVCKKCRRLKGAYRCVYGGPYLGYTFPKESEE